MGEPPIIIYFEKSRDLNMTLKAPVMRANLILDVVSLHSRIIYQIDDKERRVFFVTDDGGLY
jgi:hypothetical protein